MTQPVVIQPPRRTALKVIAVLSILALIASLIANGVLAVLLVLTATSALAGTSTNPAENVVQTVYQPGGPDKIAILPAVGTVDEAMAERIHDDIAAIRDDHSIRAVILEVDSPGGTIAASDRIHHMLEDLAQQYPLYVAMDGLAASGGYYISMPAREIFARPSTLTGSIGVIWPDFEVTGLLKKIGVTPEIITSDQAIWKDAGSPFKQFTPADVAYIKDLVNQAHVQFSAVVADGRKGKLNEPMDQVAIGKVFSAQTALKMGLVDKIAYLDQACADVAAANGLTNPTIVRLGHRAGILESLGITTPARSPKLELSPDLLFDLQSTRPEYRYLPPMTMR